MTTSAAIIITNANAATVTEHWLNSVGGEFSVCEQRETDVDLSEQLLADLRILADPDWDGTWDDLKDAAARVQALLPKEDDDE